jgi:hypothetical protein
VNNGPCEAETASRGRFFFRGARSEETAVAERLLTGESMAKSTKPLFSCGHPRTEKGKHKCPKCRAAGQGEKRARHVSLEIYSAKRAAAALARIDEVVRCARNRREIAARLGVSRQRVHQLLRWRETQLSAVPRKTAAKV